MSPNTCSPIDASRPKSQLAADIVLAAGEVLRVQLSVLEPKDVPLSWAPEVMAAFASVERMAQSGRLMMMSRASEAKEWQRSGFATPEEWLASKLGTSTGRARGDLETSERLGGLDATADAVRAGSLSPEQAGAVADAAVVNPAAEADLLEQAAKESLARTRREAERRKAEKRSEQSKAERERQVREDRRARFWFANGEGHLEVCGPVAELKELEQQIQRAVDRKFRANRATDQRGSRANYAFDALMELGSGDGGGSARRASVTRMTMIRVDLAALKRGRITVGEVCEIGGVAVSVAELRRVLGDSVLQLVLTNGEAVIDVVNLNRQPTVAQKLAKLFTDSTCCVQGCDRAAVIEFDHRDDWVRVKVTELVNLDVFCDHHHDLKTYENWQLVAGAGRRPMVPPTDPRHPDHVGQSKTGSEPPMVDAVEDEAAVEPCVPVAEAEPGMSSESDSRIADLAARLARIKRKEAEHRARLAGQDRLFDAG